ncbi:MAG: L-rhamnose/proton symporter RhaT [Bacteroidales bacterium]|jgi:L-rhamnose-H+ transport protein|nr:L-rhamnose/proton symporter RhaT [Bacteroidales bacterium]
MNTLIGLLIIAIGSFGQSSSYVPIRKVKDWAWECFWLTQGIFAWLLFPYLGALMAVPSGESLLGIFSTASSDAIFKTIGFGALWGVGGLTFGLSMRYLGIALGQSLALGTCSAFGTLIPALLKGDNLFRGDGLILLIGVSIAIAGIAVIGYAGALKSKNMSEEEKKKAVKDFALKKGLLIALLAGVMSACFSLGLNAGIPIKEHLLKMGAPELYAGLPTTLLVTIGGFLTNAVYCIYQNIKNKTGKQYFSVSGNVLANNILFCALAGLLWYSQFFGLGVGQSFFEPNSVMMAFSWSILMSLNVLFSNVWGILLKEWKGSGQKTIVVLVIGLLILVVSIVFPQLMK